MATNLRCAEIEPTCPEARKTAFGWTIQPFPAPKFGEIAVRVVTAGGGMMSRSGPAKAQ